MVSSGPHLQLVAVLQVTVVFLATSRRWDTCSRQIGSYIRVAQPWQGWNWSHDQSRSQDSTTPINAAAFFGWDERCVHKQWRKDGYQSHDLLWASRHTENVWGNIRTNCRYADLAIAACCTSYLNCQVGHGSHADSNAVVPHLSMLFHQRMQHLILVHKIWICWEGTVEV